MANGRTDGSQGAIVAVLVIIAIVLVAGILYLAGVFGPQERTVEVDLNGVDAPAEMAPEPTPPNDDGTTRN